MLNLDYGALFTTVATTIAIPFVGLVTEMLFLQYFVEERTRVELGLTRLSPRQRQLVFELAAGVPRIMGLSAFILGVVTMFALLFVRNDLRQYSPIIAQYGHTDEFAFGLLILGIILSIFGLFLTHRVYTDELGARGTIVRTYHRSRDAALEVLLSDLAACRKSKERLQLTCVSMFALCLPLALIFGSF